MPHTVHVTKIIDAPIESIWKIISNFNGLPSYHPIIKKSVIEGPLKSQEVGSIRHLTIDNGFVREKLLKLDNINHEFEYSIIESSLPVVNYRAGVRLKANALNTFTICEWWADFEVINANFNDIHRLVETEVFKAGLDALDAKIQITNLVAYH